MNAQSADDGFANSSSLRLFIVGLFVFLIGPAFCQSRPAYEVGTILEVKVHQPAEKQDALMKRYDISVKVGNTIYLVLFTPPEGSNIVEYKTGLDLPVLVVGKTMKFTDTLGRPVIVPILNQQQAAKQREQ
jgi:hypothetical protein